MQSDGWNALCAVYVTALEKGTTCVHNLDVAILVAEMDALLDASALSS